MSKVTLQIEDKVGIITIDAPPVNALDKTVIDELENRIEEIDAHINVVIVTGAGSKAFVAGADITEFPNLTENTGEKMCMRGQSVFNKLSNLKQPVIAAIDGFTLGGGLELALACDIRIATTTSSLGLPEVTLGVIPGYGGTQRLPRLIGSGKAMQMIFSGDPVSADKAYQIGLVDEVTENDVLQEAKDLANKIASRAPIAVQSAKEAIQLGVEMPLNNALKLEAKQFGSICNTEDKVEGVSAFLEKRKPIFKGK